ncbi:c-type cytochrome [Pseudohoeflea coraliihabitans]|uniref:C-type cytochrome n=1 Tax=Pseudohoeflea coraliihabitans TaxID=2860393 RepID=A0ABS6WP91_9HYPH|nr:c-type cytochrome [Pseudohoeflea sp. DP4N28-3]
MNSSYLNAAAGAFLGVVFVVMTLSIVSEGLFHSEAPEQAGFAIVADESAGSGDAAPAEEGLPEIAPLMASADPAAGENVFKKCAACHTVDPSGTNKVGPGLYNVVGAEIAAHEGFNYSSALQEYAEGRQWDYEHLNRFLFAPKKEVRGTAMGFAGLKKEEDRANVIAYLREQSDSPAPLPSPEEAAADDDAAADDEAAAGDEETVAGDEAASEETDTPATDDAPATADTAASEDDGVAARVSEESETEADPEATPDGVISDETAPEDIAETSTESDPVAEDSPAEVVTPAEAEADEETDASIEPETAEELTPLEKPVSAE